jgi:DNA-binding transcriptional ArsR family regulator
MPLRSLVTFDVTPRFDIFYALRALGDPAHYAAEWSRRSARALPQSFNGLVRRVAPRPVIWALLADVLQDAKPDPKFAEIGDTIRSLEDEPFQRSILGGVFRTKGLVSELLSGKMSLREAVQREAAQTSALISVVGLYPYDRAKAVADAFERMINKPAEYRADLIRAIEMFWTKAFSETWRELEPLLKRQATAMRDSQAAESLAAFAAHEKLPVVFDDEKKAVMSSRGAELFPYRLIRAIHFVPSAFNDARFWGAYRDAAGSVTLYFPMFDSTILRDASKVNRRTQSSRAEITDPALGFRALGDTTRYAMASLLARSPRTSVELAREFGVSKATVSHHVQLLREAGLLTESSSDRGVALSLNRGALEELSHSAAREMFSQEAQPVVARSRKGK